MAETQTTAPADPGAVEADPALAQAEAEDSSSGPKRHPERLAAVAGAVWLVVGAAALVAVSRRSVELDEGEALLLRFRPRRAVGRYLSSLGLWELARRSTQFAVTDRRVVMGDGVVYQRTRSIPLSSIQHVAVLAGPWAGFVELGGRSGPRERIGPLRSPRARQFANTVLMAAAAVRSSNPPRGTT